MQAFHQQAGRRGLPHSVSAGLGFHPSLPPGPPRSTLLGVAVAKELLKPVGVLRGLCLVEEVLLGLRVLVVVLVVIGGLVCGEEKGMDAWRSYNCYKATPACGSPQPWPCHRCWRELEVLAPARMLGAMGHRGFAIWWRGTLQAQTRGMGGCHPQRVRPCEQERFPFSRCFDPQHLRCWQGESSGSPSPQSPSEGAMSPPCHGTRATERTHACQHPPALCQPVFGGAESRGHAEAPPACQRRAMVMSTAKLRAERF